VTRDERQRLEDIRDALGAIERHMTRARKEGAAHGKLTTCKAPGFGPQDAGSFTLGPSTITSDGGTKFKT